MSTVTTSAVTAAPTGDAVEYPSLNGFGRKAMVKGVPLVPGVLVVASSLVLTTLGMLIFGAAAVLTLAIAVPILIFFKQISETDDDAVRILYLEVRCYLGRGLPACFGNTYTLAPIKYGRNLHVYRRPFEKSSSR